MRLAWLIHAIYEGLSKLHVPCYFFRKEDAIYTEQCSNFGEVEFKAICNEKPYIVWHVMQLGYSVLWTDSGILLIFLLHSMLVIDPLQILYGLRPLRSL